MNAQQSAALAIISAMIAPAVLIVGAGSLIASALVRHARVVDRSRLIMVQVADDRVRASRPAAFGAEALARHQRGVRANGQALAAFFAAVAVFVVDSIAIALAILTGDIFPWLPVALTVAGMLLLVMGAVAMLWESRLDASLVMSELADAQRQVEAGESPAKSAGVSP